MVKNFSTQSTLPAHERRSKYSGTSCGHIYIYIYIYIRTRARAHIYTHTHTHQLSPSRYTLSLISFPNLNLITLLHLLSSHPFFKYSHKPTVFTTLYHLPYLDSLIFCSFFSRYFSLSFFINSPITYHPPFFSHIQFPLLEEIPSLLLPIQACLTLSAFLFHFLPT